MSINQNLQGRRRVIMWEKSPSSSSATDNTSVVAMVLCGKKKIESENFLTEKIASTNL